jgi:hypothetical protein
MGEMKKLIVIALALGTVFAAEAQQSRRRSATRKPAGEETTEAAAQEGRVLIEQFPRLGRSCRLMAPALQGASMIGQCYKKPREWIVVETKYQTDARWTDQLTFTWHVLLETKTQTEKMSAGERAKMAPFSYFTTSVTYYNIPKGSHAASVCLHPSYLERFGEPKAVGLVVTSKDGEVVAGDSASEIKGIKGGTKFWEDDNIMNAKTATGDSMIERRQGLLDRSKTIWALVNPNDYELVLQ